MTDDTIETTTASTLPPPMLDKWAPPDPVHSPVGGPEGLPTDWQPAGQPGWHPSGDRTVLTTGELPPVKPAAEVEEPPVSQANADDAKKRLAEHRLFRNGIRSYRVPEWDAGHLSRGVKYVYITERMITPHPTGDGVEIAVANATAAAYLKVLTDAINAGTAQALVADNSVFAPGDAVYAPEAGEISEVVALLNDALERMSANALSTAGAYIGRAIQILEG
jgi:hypothetical protein